MKFTLRYLFLLAGIITYGQVWADSELFLRIEEPGRYTVTLDDQTITLSSGRYRFFDLPAGRQRLIILRNNAPVYQDWVDLRPDSRTVAEFLSRQGLRVMAVFPLMADGRSGSSDWASPVGTNSGYEERPGAYSRQRTAMAAPEFDRIQQAVRAQPFDDGKFDLLRTVLPDRPLSSAQLVTLLKLFTFDTKRLEAAKIGWDSVTDRSNFYLVFDVFTFSTSTKELKAYMSSR